MVGSAHKHPSSTHLHVRTCGPDDVVGFMHMFSYVSEQAPLMFSPPPKASSSRFIRFIILGVLSTLHPSVLEPVSVLISVWSLWKASSAGTPSAKSCRITPAQAAPAHTGHPQPAGTLAFRVAKYPLRVSNKRRRAHIGC